MHSLLQKAYAVWTDKLSKPSYTYTIQSAHPHLLYTTPVVRHLKDLDYISPRVFYPSQVSEHQQVFLYAFPNVTLEVLHMPHTKMHMSNIVRVVCDYLRFFQRVLPASAFKTPLHLGLAFSPVRKNLPHKAGAPIEPEHINGGVTWKQHGLVFVYRREEWEKVLLHELFHFYEFDYHPSSMRIASTSAILSKSLAMDNNIYTRSGAVALNEAYAETLATLFYVAYSILRRKGKDRIQSTRPYAAFLKSWRGAMATAQHHFHNQILKVLAHFKGGPWTETTHAFAYYVCKAALLFDLPELFKWSDQHDVVRLLQNDRSHVDQFAKFMEKQLHAPRFVKTLCKLAKTMSIKNLTDPSLIMLSFQSNPRKIT